MPADASALVANIGGVGVIALVLWLIWRQYRADKHGEDAQTDAAAMALLRELRDELNTMRERVAVLEDRERRQADVLARHAAWDAKAIAVLQQSADPTVITGLGDPPPLYPPGG